MKNKYICYSISEQNSKFVYSLLIHHGRYELTKKREKTKVDAPHAIGGFHNYMQTFIFSYVIINQNLRSIGLLFTESFALQRTLIWCQKEKKQRFSK